MRPRPPCWRCDAAVLRLHCMISAAVSVQRISGNGSSVLLFTLVGLVMLFVLCRLELVQLLRDYRGRSPARALSVTACP